MILFFDNAAIIYVITLLPTSPLTCQAKPSNHPIAIPASYLT